MGDRGLRHPRARLTPLRPAGPAAVDPHARRATRWLIGVGAWLRPLRWVLAGAAVYSALQLLPYATWQAPAPWWAVIGLAVASVLWLVLPGAVVLAGRRGAVTVADLGPSSAAAGHLRRACDARTRFETAAALLGEPRRWLTEARARVGDTTWRVAVRAREMAVLEEALSRTRSAEWGPLRQEEERRLADELETRERLVTQLTSELVELADVAERTAVAVSRCEVQPGAELSDDERSSVDALRWFRLRLQALEEAWVELQDR